MLPLLIQISNQDSGVRVDAGFKRSPVRIGRNALNDLAIDEGFVSQWHGLVRFDESGIRFLDLGSTNGTFLGEDRLEKNVEIDLNEDRELTIGPLRLRFLRVALKSDQLRSRRGAAFALGGTTRAAKGVGAGGTVELGGAARQSADELTKTLISSLAGGGVPMGLDEIRAMAKRQRELLDRLAPLHQAYEAARRGLDEAIAKALSETPSSAERDIRAGLLRDAYPIAFEHAPVRAAAGLAAEGAGGGADAMRLVSGLAPSVAGQWEDSEAALERVGAVLEAFASAFLDLRAGQKQIRGELSVEPGSEVDSVPAFDDSRGLLAYLLDPTADASIRLDELARAFADVALHQLAMVRGAMEGTRALLAVLSPQGIGTAGAGQLARTSLGVSDVLWPFRAAGHYYRYVQKHLDLSTGERFAVHLFGSSFGRAYYRVTGAKR